MNDQEIQRSLFEYNPKKNIFDVLNESVKNTAKINLVRATIVKNNTRFNASLILKDVKFDLIAKAVFNIKYSYTKKKPKFIREALIKALIWKRFCNIKRTTDLVQLLSENGAIAKNLGFDDKIPSKQWIRTFETYLLRDEYVEKIIFRIIKRMKRNIRRTQKWD